MTSHTLYICITLFGGYLGIISMDTTNFIFIVIIVHWVLSEKLTHIMTTIDKYEKKGNDLFLRQLVALIITIAALSIYEFFFHEKYNLVIVTLVLICVTPIIFTIASRLACGLLDKTRRY